MVAEVTADAVDNGTDACDSEEGGGGGFLNTAVLTSGGQVTPVEDCAEPIFPEIDKSAAGEAVQDPATGIWTLEYDITVSYPDTDADPLPVLGYVLTDAPTLPDGVELVGDWAVSAANADTPTPDDPTWDGAGTWTIVTAGFDPEDDGITQHVFTVTAEVQVTEPPTGTPEVCDELEDSGLVVINTATVTSGGYTADDDACQVVQYDDVSLEKTAELAEGETSVEPGDAFDYVLTVTNNGTRAAEDVHVFDESFSVAPYVDRIQITAVEWAPDTLAVTDASDLPGNIVDLTIAQLGVGESATITVSVVFLEAPDSDAVEPDELPDPLDDLVNTACVETELDPIDGVNGGNNCDTETVPTRDMIASVYTTCRSDAPLLGFIVKTSASLADVQGTMVWTPDTATPETDPPNVTQAFTAGADGYRGRARLAGLGVHAQRGGDRLPGLAAAAGVRLRPRRRVHLSGGRHRVPARRGRERPRIRLQRADPGRQRARLRVARAVDVVISVNPEMTFAVEYPAASPECFQARHSDVQIEKTASKERMTPGRPSRTRSLPRTSPMTRPPRESSSPTRSRRTSASRMSPGLAKATPPPSRTTPTARVTGQAAGGYGGTLTCTLFGPLQPAGAGLGPSAAPVITLTAVSNPTTSATSIDNVAVVDYHTFGDPEDAGRDADNALVYLSILALTGSVLADGLIWAALLALFGGVLLVHATRRRRQQAIPRG